MIYREEIDTLLSEIHALRIAVERIALLAQEMGLESVRRGGMRHEARDWEAEGINSPQASSLKPQASSLKSNLIEESDR
ncbi:MAG: hypothetical protein MN733_07640 [Nitrososphaera sp.]|nr:hypothetical protein [Nitrososphaera sp.]